MYEKDLGLNNLRRLIYHKIQPNHIYLIYMYREDLGLIYNGWYAIKSNQIIYI